MVLSFLIGTLVFFVLNLFLSLVSVAVNANDKDATIVPAVFNLFISLVFITWNILAIINL